MTYEPAKNFCSEEQLLNLEKLLSFLKTEVELLTEFDMLYFYNNKKIYMRISIPGDVKNECGTVCCLAGHGPLAGVNPLLYESWNSYVERVFTENNDVFIFLFESEWEDFQPTKEEAIFRLELFLKKGFPVSFRDSLARRYNYALFTRECTLKRHTLD